MLLLLTFASIFIFILPSVARHRATWDAFARNRSITQSGHSRLCR